VEETSLYHTEATPLKIDRIETSGLVVLFVGVALLAFTFFSAYGFLVGKLNIIASADLIQFFGTALAPLVEAAIRILYLAIMGWISSILTIRGVQLLKKEKEAIPAAVTPVVKAEKKPEASPQPKPEAKQKPQVKEVGEPAKTEEAEKKLDIEETTEIVEMASAE